MDDADPVQKLERELDHYFATRKDAILFSRSTSTGGGFVSSNLEGIYPEWVFPQLRRPVIMSESVGILCTLNQPALFAASRPRRA
jgi:hypothetical protein